MSGLLAVTAALTVKLDAAGSFLIVDGQPLGSTRLVSKPYVYFLDTTQLTNGTHTLQVWAHDINNNTDLSSTISIVVAN